MKNKTGYREGQPVGTVRLYTELGLAVAVVTAPFVFLVRYFREIKDTVDPRCHTGMSIEACGRVTASLKELGYPRTVIRMPMGEALFTAGFVYVFTSVLLFVLILVLVKA
jgi:hypothetical protein